MGKKISIFIFTAFISCVLLGKSQQTASKVEPPRTADLSYNPEIEKPAFSLGKGPIVLVDEAHNNFHTSVGTYLPFANLLERDGYVIERGQAKISPESLRTCRIFVISDAQPPPRKGDPPTFSQDEIEILTGWVKKGGSLFLITDHMPDPAAIKNLAYSFGIEVNNGYVLNNHFSETETPMVFERSDQSLIGNPITNGRNFSESVHSVATFGGSAFKADTNFLPVLLIKADKRSWMPRKLYDFREDTPNVSVSGWYQGAVSNFGQGKIAFFSEAAMFTAQIFNQGKIHVGMNHPLAEDNSQLLLNVVHWLSDLL